MASWAGRGGGYCSLHRVQGVANYLLFSLFARLVCVWRALKGYNVNGLVCMSRTSLTMHYQLSLMKRKAWLRVFGISSLDLPSMGVLSGHGASKPHGEASSFFGHVLRKARSDFALSILRGSTNHPT